MKVFGREGFRISSKEGRPARNIGAAIRPAKEKVQQTNAPISSIPKPPNLIFALSGFRISLWNIFDHTHFSTSILHRLVLRADLARRNCNLPNRRLESRTRWKMENDVLRIAGKEFHSRLIVGTGKYRSFQEMARAHEASGAEIVTVAVRRVNLTDRSKESLLDYIDRKKYFILPNTAGCYSADDAVRAARLGREVGLSHWVKLEVIGDEKTLFPDNFELVKATEQLAREGFVVLPYTNDDLISARRLIDAGAAAVMPLGAPIGSGLGIQN